MIRKITDVTYQIQKDPKSPYKVVHVDQLKPYEGNLPPTNWTYVDTSLDESLEPPTCMTPEPAAIPDAMSDTASPVFNVPSPEPVRQSRWGRKIKPPAVYSP